jgi:large subunit ribosomal protein L9
MKVILRATVPNLGRAGDVKDIKDGYGRNFLFPNNLAMPATPAAMKEWEKGKDARAKRLAVEISKTKELADKINGVSLSFSRPAGEEGKLFGSVGKADVVKSLKTCGFEVDKAAVVLDQPIKQVGDHEIEIRLMPEVTAKIKVTVSPRE